MPLSTSSSEILQRDAVQRSSVLPQHGIIGLVAALVVFLVGLELASPLVMARMSRTERRVRSELKGAQGLQPATPDGRQTVLLAGNSLLLEGVQIDRLRATLATRYAISRLAIEQTQYLDWYFGLRRLLEEGARPSVIVLSLATDQFASRLTMEESFANRQMSTRDFLLVVKKVGLNRTTASTYLFAHWSDWLAEKAAIRQRVSILLIPRFRELSARIVDHGPHVNDPAVLLASAQERLPELDILSRTYGVKIVLLIPPTLREDNSSRIQAMGAADGVPVWVPSPPGEFPRKLYRDGFHLNDEGAEIFTDRLASQIRQQIANKVAACLLPEGMGTTKDQAPGRGSDGVLSKPASASGDAVGSSLRE